MSGYPPVPPEVIAAMAKDNQSPLIIGIVSAFTALAFVCVLLRFFSRIKLVGIVGMEDYFIALSMVSAQSCHQCKGLYLPTASSSSQSALRHA
jgi:hypothetical protein